MAIGPVERRTFEYAPPEGPVWMNGVPDAFAQLLDKLVENANDFAPPEGAVRISLGDLEYWICSSDPEHDQPRRHTALRQTNGDPWAALQLLCTPNWHDTQRQPTNNGPAT